jgi:peptidoglycan/LPS O-acetylase OafA/YrhL
MGRLAKRGAEPHQKIPHLPALDGLRGLALAGVLLFHANGTLRGGYLGVDLFFVLSGYLITSLLLAEHAATGRIALAPFWIRRARRLFPALLSMMPAIALYARFVAKPSELAGLRTDALATLGYVANWRAIFSHKSYWELFASPSPLEHCWSLSIEEQFYVVWPLLVALVLRRSGSGEARSSRSILVVSLVLTAASMGAMLWLFDPSKTSRVYLGTDTRAASILAGAALAAVISPSTTFTQSTVRKLDVLGVVAIVGLAVAWVKLEGANRFLYRGGFWLTELGALVLIVCAVSGPRSLVARLLGMRPLAWLGTISYGVYLWHWPVNVLLSPQRLHLRGFWLHVLQLALTFLIAIVSYRFLEKPIRTRGIPFGRPLYVVPAVVALAIVMVVGGTVARAAALDPKQLALQAQSPPGGGGAAFEPVFEPAQFRVMLLGDSTANSLGWGLRGVRQPGLVVELMGHDGCTMLATTLCDEPLWAERTTQVKPNATLLFLGGAFLHGVTLDGDWRKSCYPGWDSKFETNLQKRLGDLKSPSGRVWLVTLPYPLDVYDNDTFRHEVDCINASIRRSAAAVPGIEVLELGERLCPKGVCQREHEGVEIRPDGVHYTIDGASSLSRWVLEQIQR